MCAGGGEGGKRSAGVRYKRGGRGGAGRESGGAGGEKFKMPQIKNKRQQQEVEVFECHRVCVCVCRLQVELSESCAHHTKHLFKRGGWAEIIKKDGEEKTHTPTRL